MDLLKLVALERDEVDVISAHLQDAVVRVADIVWRPDQMRLALGLNRFDWEAAQNGGARFHRRRAALRFDRVRSVKCRNLDPKDHDAILNLLAVEFAETDCPGGVVTLMFSGGGALRLEVECLEVELVDLGPVWPTWLRPRHQAGERRDEHDG